MGELNPVLVKELRGRMRGVRSFVLLTIFLALLGGATLLFYAVLASQSGNDLNAGRQIGQALFLMIAFAALVGVSIITPSLTAGALAGERERQSFDLLIASQLSPWQIVLGKLGSALAFALLIIAAVVPLMSIALLFGGVSFTEIAIALAGLVATAVLYASVGLFWSGVMRSTLGANGLAIGTVALILLGIPFLALIGSIPSGFAMEMWMGSPVTAVLSRLFLSFHPFVALGLTEASLQSGEGPLLVTAMLTDGSSIQVLSPWLMFVATALLSSALLLALTVRQLRPERAERVGKRKGNQAEA
ncbi:MAG: ABC transporter permease [Roseiflexaceae bacterium]|nr:ABC transporter permease [Roseiflexaceae bacterium]